ncbi:hypothetical protein SCP_0706520 [Sparassis crispa]|uniref:Fungal-type protein kinase domain-containing protein n=1 Tax=Sparassis crispa TaxID=139825 RepID=A0A401GTB5_9APHY|nr:hypothetical protein SCP_0706520 [Sparassis crispa]GBE85465.1 hypothetical protein SCP_0706520 [Sparassis crispa]
MISLLGVLCREAGNAVSGPRHLLRKLEPIENLKGVPFVRAWIDCYRCHFRLWLHGVEHGDISLSNLMYDPDIQRGMLNNFNLAVIHEGPGECTPAGKMRMGMVSFMVLDLLTPGYYGGKIARLYRHDLKSFVLPFALLRSYSTDQDAQLDAWCTSNYDRCCQEKSDFLITHLYKAGALHACEAIWRGIGLAAFSWLYYSKLTMHEKENTELWYGPSEDSAHKMLKMFEKKLAASLCTHPVAGLRFELLSDAQLRL